MSQAFYYIDPNGAFTVNLGSSAVRLGDYGGYSTRAEVGSIGTAQVIIDDPAGTVGYNSDAILGLKQFAVYEMDCATVGADGVNGRRLYTSYTRERTYRRGTGSRTSLVTGVSREIETALEDPNAAAGFRILNNSSSALPGTATKTSGNTSVSGSGTNWTTTLGPNFTISIPGGGGTDILYVDHVVSDTSLVVITAPTHSASGQVVTRVDASRPAETDVQRVQWLLSGYIAFGGVNNYLLVTNDAGWIDTSGGVNMDANDYTGQTPADVLHDCANASGKNWWVGFWEATGRLSLWYANSNTSTTYTSLLKLSNVLADVDSTTTFAPESDAALRRDPVQTFAGVYATYAGGHLYVSNATTASNYSWRDGSSSNSNVKTSTQATAVANRLLAQDATEIDRVTCRVRLPSTLATGIKAGQRVQAKFSHLPGYGGWSWLRVMSLQVQQDEATDKRYTLSLELTPQAPGAPEIVQQLIYGASTFSGIGVPLTPTPGNILLVTIYYNGGTSPTPSGFTPIGSPIPVSLVTNLVQCYSQCFYRVVQPGDSNVFSYSGIGGSWEAGIVEVANVTTVDSHTELSRQTSTSVGVSVTPTAGKPAIVFAVFAADDGNTGCARWGNGVVTIPSVTDYTLLTTNGVTQPGNIQQNNSSGEFWVYRIVTSTSGTYSPGFTWGCSTSWGAQAVVLR